MSGKFQYNDELLFILVAGYYEVDHADTPIS